MPSKTPRKHLEEDLRRVEALRAQARTLERSGASADLVRDVRLSAVALAVGAMDAYLCDLYADCLASVLQAYRAGRWTGNLPHHFAKRELPAGEVLDTSRKTRPLWAIRMAARSVVERDNLLRISRLEEMLNGVLPSGQKLWHGFIDTLAGHNYKRFTKHTAKDLARLSGKKLADARAEAIKTFKGRLAATIQLRHDWIHNCGRPKEAIQALTDGEAAVRILEIRLFTRGLDDHMATHRRA